MLPPKPVKLRPLTAREQQLLWTVGKIIEGDLRQPPFRFQARQVDSSLLLEKHFEGKEEPELLPNSAIVELFDNYSDNVRGLLTIITRRIRPDQLSPSDQAHFLKMDRLVNDPQSQQSFVYELLDAPPGFVLARRFDGEGTPHPVPVQPSVAQRFVELVNSYSTDMRGLLDIISHIFDRTE